MTASLCNNIVRTGVGAALLGALLLSVSPVPSLALSDPTPIGLPPLQPGDQPADQPASPPPAPSQDAGQGGIGSAPLPPLPAPPPEAQPAAQPPVQPAQPTEPSVQPVATGGMARPAPDAGAPGLLDDSNAGLGASIWQGSSGAQLISLMPKLPAPQTQPSLRDLQLRLLLTKAPGPNAGAGIDTLVPLRA